MTATNTAINAQVATSNPTTTDPPKKTPTVSPRLAAKPAAPAPSEAAKGVPKKPVAPTGKPSGPPARKSVPVAPKAPIQPSAPLNKPSSAATTTTAAAVTVATETVADGSVASTLSANSQLTEQQASQMVLQDGLQREDSIATNDPHNVSSAVRREAVQEEATRAVELAIESALLTVQALSPRSPARGDPPAEEDDIASQSSPVREEILEFPPTASQEEEAAYLESSFEDASLYPTVPSAAFPLQ